MEILLLLYEGIFSFCLLYCIAVLTIFYPINISRFESILLGGNQLNASSEYTNVNTFTCFVFGTVFSLFKKTHTDLRQHS